MLAVVLVEPAVVARAAWCVVQADAAPVPVLAEQFVFAESAAVALAARYVAQGDALPATVLLERESVFAEPASAVPAAHGMVVAALSSLFRLAR